MHVLTLFVVIFFKKIVDYTIVWIQFFLIPSWNQLQGHRKPRTPSSFTI